MPHTAKKVTAGLVVVLLLVGLAIWLVFFRGAESGSDSDEEEGYEPAQGWTVTRLLQFVDVHRKVLVDGAAVPEPELAEERFRKAQRRLPQHSLVTGVYTDKQRRHLLDRISRRPFCSQRSRSWRTQFSDFLRGDVRPQHKNNWNIMRPARANMDLDLHQGALGTVSGKGRWDSDGPSLPDNFFDDPVLQEQ